MNLLVKKSLPDQIFDLLRDRIVSGAFPVDAAIRQDALASQYGISKIPLREALVRLEQDGLIYSQANRGFFIRPLSLEEAADVFGLRLKIEPDAVAEAVPAVRPGHRAEARHCLDALNRAIPAGEGIGSLNRAFHMALIRPTGRLITMQVVERLQVMAERYVVKHLEPEGRQARAATEHEALLAAWSDGRAAEARALAAAHIQDTFDDLRAALSHA